MIPHISVALVVAGTFIGFASLIITVTNFEDSKQAINKAWFFFAFSGVLFVLSVLL